MMDCLEYRRRMTEAPGEADATLRRHRLSCAPCARWSEDAAAFEARLQESLKIPVPDGLAERVKLKASWQRPPQTHWGRLAAGMFVLVAAALVTVRSLAPEPALADALVDHMHHESELLLPSEVAVDPAHLEQVLRLVGGRLDGELGTVTHAGLCPIDGDLAAHLVVTGSNGPVAVIVMPGHELGARLPVASSGLSGAIIPVGRGSVAIIGFRGEPIEELAERVRNSVELGI